MVVFMFPGQGSQYIGMGKELFETYSEVKELFSKAEEVTGIPVKKLCFEGPMEELTRTENLQVCLTVVNIASYLGVKKECPDLTPKFVAGHSLGEYSALFAGGVLSLEDTLKAVKERGRLMESAGGDTPSGMYAIIGMPQEELEELVKSASGLVIISNYNSPKQLVISGESPAIDEVAEKAKGKKVRVVKLKVSAAFHSPLMKEAQEKFSKFLEGLSWQDSRVPFVSNVSAKAHTKGEEIKELMKKQITSSVRWIECVEFMHQNGAKVFVELGPKRVLSGLCSQILEGKEFECYNIETPEGIKNLPVCKTI
ncbi:MAG: ACP S-malonyltransferase [Thermodesulfobacteria bacterium]|nr:ACP S-malonyltransferase [Thermodesulfobacteriota bacterium]